MNYLTNSEWCGTVSHLLPTNCIEQGLLLCEAVVKAMLLLEDCDYASSIELLKKIREQFSQNDIYSETYDNVVMLLHRITDMN